MSDVQAETGSSDSIDTGDTGDGFGVVVEGFGFNGGGVVDLDGVTGGPFVTTDLVDENNQVVGVVAVTDSGDGADKIVEQLGTAAAELLHATTQPGSPAGNAAELGSRFETPTKTRTWADTDNQTTVALITGTDRRSHTTNPTKETGPGVAGVPGISKTTGTGQGAGLDKLVNVALDVSVELGRTKVTLADVLDYDVGSLVELDRAAGAPVDIRVNDTLLAQGEVVLIDDEYAVRITAIIEPHT